MQKTNRQFDFEVGFAHPKRQHSITECHSLTVIRSFAQYLLHILTL